MAEYIDVCAALLWQTVDTIRETPLSILIACFVGLVAVAVLFVYLALHLFAPTPRPPLPSEKTYITTTPAGGITAPQPLPCWHDEWRAQRQAMARAHANADAGLGYIDAAEVAMSVVVPAYNEEKRIEGMLLEAVEFLDDEYGRTPAGQPASAAAAVTGSASTSAAAAPGGRARKRRGQKGLDGVTGYEILIVSDGSTDGTERVVLEFARKHGLHDVVRFIRLTENRGKGGAVTHGFRHVRGLYAVFADADGASRFGDLGKLVDGCRKVADSPGRGVAVGSRAHLVGSEAVVKRSALRNALMHAFHMLLKILTPPATSRIRDTQCGFKLFSRAALPHIIPYMHSEGWIFDVEMLMLAESAPPGDVFDEDGNPVGSSPGIKVAEVPIHWNEVGGSKLNVIWDSLGMAWGLAVLRASWALGVYRRR